MDVHDVDAQRHHRKAGRHLLHLIFEPTRCAKWPWVLGQVAFYSSGFPCKPYSWLHWGTQLLAEPDAKPLWQSIRNFKLAAPAEPCIELTLTFHDILLMCQTWSL